MPDISSHLEEIFNNSFFINYYLVYSKESIIIIFYKQKSIRVFTSLKSYQPIRLLNIIEKIRVLVLAVKINYVATMYNLLPKMYFGN